MSTVHACTKKKSSQIQLHQYAIKTAKSSKNEHRIQLHTLFLIDDKFVCLFSNNVPMHMILNNNRNFFSF